MGRILQTVHTIKFITVTKSQKILIAEDDELFLRIISRQLRSVNFEIITARDGLEAIKKAEEFHPDIIISDWMMPKMNGKELCQKVKQHDQLKWTYFIMVTARDKIEDLVMGFESGADDFLPKPCDAQELIARVRTGLRIVALQRENIRLQRIEAINETAITANHEINNPLQTIVTSIELIQKQNPDLDKHTKENLDIISNNAMRIRNVMMKLENLIKSESIEYISDGPQMIDLDRSITKES